MEVDCIPFRATGYFSELICDYLDQHDALKPFYHRYPTIDAFRDQIAEKRSSFPQENRVQLYQALSRQYKNTTTSKRTQEHIQALREEKTFTVVTGHQLNLFTGPLYFIYKIVSTINLTAALKKAYPDFHFVPVYWMATEDHDFDEINYFNFQGKKIQWNLQTSGAVGRLKTAGLEAVFETFSSILGGTRNALQLRELFHKAYLENDSLTEATRYLANALFGEYGLVILDGDDKALKQLLPPYIKKDLLEQSAYKEVMSTNRSLQEASSQYRIQVNPREINYFYLNEGLRERIVEQDGRFEVRNSALGFSKKELLKEVEEHPERFSPNVISRPLYQEVVLPNLCYIGGGGELAYWLQLKSAFGAVAVPFPMLLLRNSALLISKKQRKKLERLQLELPDLFLPQNTLLNKKIREISNIDIDFSPQKRHLEEQFAALYELATQTDRSFLGSVKAQEVKQLKGLDKLEKRLLKAQKIKLKDQVLRMTDLQNQLFPLQSLQERNSNFSVAYLDMGRAFIPELLEHLDPLQQEFLVLTY